MVSRQRHWPGIERVHAQRSQAEWHEFNLISAQWHWGGIEAVHMQRSQHGFEDSSSLDEWSLLKRFSSMRALVTPTRKRTKKHTFSTTMLFFKPIFTVFPVKCEEKRTREVSYLYKRICRWNVILRILLCRGVMSCLFLDYIWKVAHMQDMEIEVASTIARCCLAICMKNRFK